MNIFKKLKRNIMAKRIIYNVGRTVINGKTITGSVITIENGRMLVDGKPFEDWSESEEKVINITIEGNVEELQASGCNTIVVKGDAKNIKTGSGDVTVEGVVKGNVNTGSGDVRCGNVEEDVNTGSGDVHCGDVRGRVSTMSGDVYKR